MYSTSRIGAVPLMHVVVAVLVAVGLVGLALGALRALRREIALGIGLEAAQAAGGAEVIGLAFVGGLVFGFALFHFHAANGVNRCHRGFSFGQHWEQFRRRV